MTKVSVFPVASEMVMNVARRSQLDTYPKALFATLQRRG